MSDLVHKIQTRLAQLGFDPGPLDGLKGPRTDAALVAFKRSIGLRARPYLGPLTIAALLRAETTTKIPWMAEALRMKGIHEDRDQATLRAWFDRSVSWIDPRETPWCGAFVATCLRAHDPDIALPKNPLGAWNWTPFGQICPPVFGAIMVFWRGSRTGWKGHVAFYEGEDSTHFHVCGGNQSNAVTRARIAKSRLLAARWPNGQEVTGKRVLLDASGVPVSTNEA